ncbi:MAG TPA: TPM domain-containing protein [Tenuifilaceae bacterium]|nr:TPM domain-containing protein [Tenuifilaceae bacterium]
MKRFFSFILFLGLFISPAYVQEIPDPMYPPRLVNDFAGLLNSEEVNRLEYKLRNYHDTTSTQIYIITVSDLMGYDLADFAFRIGEKWGIGQKGKDNGLIIMIKPKVGNERGEAMIATGYGLEDVIPDAIAKRIIDRELVPEFQENNFYEGLDKATTTIIDLASGKFSGDEYMEVGWGVWIIPLFIFIVIFSSIISNIRKMRGKSIGHDLPLWTAIGMMSSMGRGSSSGGYSGFSSGRGSFGGFSGGGGGSFGGGGARGSW